MVKFGMTSQFLVQPMPRSIEVTVLTVGFSEFVPYYGNDILSQRNHVDNDLTFFLSCHLNFPQPSKQRVFPDIQTRGL